ncbi:hypothetical protein GCM10010307_43640 [Streptomyces vastus]|uniref:Uncharacterized protein n=1 Tax=Streptomyces vastus TaxID=285451 RepID=A0ABP6DCY8_9ACTN
MCGSFRGPGTYSARCSTETVTESAALSTSPSAPATTCTRESAPGPKFPTISSAEVGAGLGDQAGVLGFEEVDGVDSGEEDGFLVPHELRHTDGFDTVAVVDADPLGVLDEPLLVADEDLGAGGIPGLFLGLGSGLGVGLGSSLGVGVGVGGPLVCHAFFLREVRVAVHAAVSLSRGRAGGGGVVWPSFGCGAGADRDQAGPYLRRGRYLGDRFAADGYFSLGA